MNNIEIVKLIDSGIYPENPIIPLDNNFENENGIIKNLAHIKGYTQVIESKKNTVRANHYHKTDWHLSYIFDGEIDYYWKQINSDKVNNLLIKKGQLFFTPPMVIHAMKFTQPTVFLTISKNQRDHISHENDVIRVKLV